jgi:hypothetical protein
MEGTETWRFGDIRETSSMRIAHRVRVDVDGHPSRSFDVASVERSGTHPSIFEIPRLLPDDALFESNDSALVVVRARTGHVLTPVSVDGGEPAWFILDTGAGGSTLIDSRIGSTLDAPDLGSIPALGVFGKMPMRIRRGTSLVAGPFTLQQPFLLEQDLSFLAPIHDEPVLGILGYDVLARCVVEIDLGEDKIVLHDPGAFDPGAASWEDLLLPYRIPVVPASYEGGRRGLFRIDVGAGGAGFSNVAFHSGVVEEEQLLSGRAVQEADLGGSPIAIGTLEYFELGGCRFDHPTVVFNKGGAGPLSDEWTDGNLGIEFLKPFRLLLDYPNARLAFVRKNCPPR